MLFCFAFAGLDILFSMSLILICMFFQEDKLKKDAATNFEASPQLVWFLRILNLVKISYITLVIVCVRNREKIDRQWKTRVCYL